MQRALEAGNEGQRWQVAKQAADVRATTVRLLARVQNCYANRHPHTASCIRTTPLILPLRRDRLSPACAPVPVRAIVRADDNRALLYDFSIAALPH